MLSLSNNEKTLVSEHLEKLGRGEIEPQRINFGICSEIHQRFPTFFIGVCPVIFVGAYASTWERFSGIDSFPVPCEPCGIESSMDAAIRAYSFRSNLWAKDLYGNDRRELCLFIAAKLRDEVASISFLNCTCSKHPAPQG